MVYINTKNLNKLFKKTSIFILSFTIIYSISFELGYLIRYAHILNFNTILQEYLYLAYPFIGISFIITLFFSISMLYITIMSILSLIVNFLWKRDIIKFTNTINMSIFEKILRHIWLFLD